MNAVKLTDNDGRMLPAIRNLVTLTIAIVFFFFGWFGHVNWSLRGEADQLVSDAKEVAESNKQTVTENAVLIENVKNAKDIKQGECDCGDATDIEFMRELRRGRETGFKFDGTNPFSVH